MTDSVVEREESPRGLMGVRLIGMTDSVVEREESPFGANGKERRPA